MNEVVKVSIAGIGFVLDNEAYEVLRKYIDILEKGYRSNPDGKEIIADIEARIVEHILSKQSGDQIVGKETIKDITMQLGTPEGMASGEDDTNTASGPDITENKFPRRFYREMENSKLGGVCSGLARYFDTDPVVFRIGIFIPLFLLILLPTLRFNALNGFWGSLLGAFVLLYMLLWILVPAAKTPRQKLEMTGKKITAVEIERIISEEPAAVSPQKQKSPSVFAKLFTILGKLLLFLINLILIIIGFALAFAIIAVIVGAFTFSFKSSKPDVIINIHDIFAGVEDVSPGILTLMLIGVALIPAIILTYQIVRFVLGRKNNGTLMWILSGTWILLTVATLVILQRNNELIINNIENKWYSSGKVRFVLDPEDMDEIDLLIIDGKIIISDGEIESPEYLLERYSNPDADATGKGAESLLIIGQDTVINQGKVVNINKFTEILNQMDKLDNYYITFKQDGMSSTIQARTK